MIALYYHGGSTNHGCEAIVRSTAKILNFPVTLFSFSPEEDLKYGIESVAKIINDEAVPVKKGSFAHFICAADHKLKHNDYKFVKYAHKDFLSRVSKGDIYMSIGGDNYCYVGVDKLGYYNRMLHEKGAKTVLWGCSIEPSVLTPKVVEDLKRYDLITVRESLSYEGLINAGVKDNVILCSDPAFQLDKAEASLPEGFSSSDTIGINASPLSIKCGNLVLENFVELIRYIIEETPFKVLLIPHVVKPETDDRESLKEIYDNFAGCEKLAILEDMNCCELKGIISQCRMFIGARTHATIAAYSTCVPTLVAGYSIKAKGIAKDIFGTYENYVIPVQSFEDNSNLKNAFIWMQENEEQIRHTLEKVMPDYCKKSLDGGEAVRRLMSNG